MSKVEKLSVAVTAEQADELRSAVREGAFASSSEAVRDALRDWSQKRRLHAAAVDKVRKLWDDGVASGVSEHYRTADEISAEGRRRLAEMK
jgi:antitoxin ParD1/3/4